MKKSKRFHKSVKGWKWWEENESLFPWRRCAYPIQAPNRRGQGGEKERDRSGGAAVLRCCFFSYQSDVISQCPLPVCRVMGLVP